MQLGLSEFRKRKMNHVFDLADLDGDGSISYKDFTLFRDNLEAQGAIAPKGTPKYERLQAELMATWNNMREAADTNRDDKVTRAEWLAWTSKLNDEAEAKGGAYPFESFMSSLIDLLDFDDDGYVGLAEYQAAAKAWSMKNIDVATNL
jgi:EF-hand domain pair